MAGRASNNIPPSIRKIWQEEEEEDRHRQNKTYTQNMASASSKAIVCRDTLQNGGWKMEDVSLRPLKEGELLIEMVASGICHTDIVAGSLPDGAAPIAFYPRVLGHEGSGYVKEIGPGVTVAAPGDPVLLSYNFCNACAVCKEGHHSHCPSFAPLNFGGPWPTFASATHADLAHPDISGSFFGQSSFASLSIVAQTSVVNAKTLVHSRDELKLFAPLGCGVQTGSGSVLNTAGAKASDTICILGLGGVGLSAVLGAKLAGCRTIIGVDRVGSRLELAKELGCTHVVNGDELPEGKSLVDVVREIADDLGPHITVDTSGAPPLMDAGYVFTRNRGKYVQVGSAPFDYKLSAITSFDFMMAGKQWLGAVEGHAYPPEYVPKMVQWYREGKFPIDKFVKYMPADEFMRGVQEMHDGTTIKPILVW